MQPAIYLITSEIYQMRYVKIYILKRRETDAL